MSTLHDSPIPPSLAPGSHPRPPGSRSARQAMLAIGLIPVGLLVATALGLLLRTLFGLPMISPLGEPPVTLAHSVVLMGVGLIVGLTAPVSSLILAIRARRAGHPRGTVLVVATSMIVAFMTVVPLVDLLLQNALLDSGR